MHLPCLQVKNLVMRAAATASMGVLIVELSLHTLQQGEAAITAAFAAAIDAHSGRVKMAVVDHVVSFPPVRIPVEEIASLCRHAGAKGEACAPAFACLCVCAHAEFCIDARMPWP